MNVNGVFISLVKVQITNLLLPVNGVTAICLLYAKIFRDQMLREGALALLQHCPPGEDNSATSTITEQLTGERFALGSAVLQQGALQLYRFYCTEEGCRDCAVGKIVFNPGVPSSGRRIR